jgi:hypothetical protein
MLTKTWCTSNRESRASSATVSSETDANSTRGEEAEKVSTPAATAVKPPPALQATDLGKTVAQYAAGVNDQTGDKLRFENGTVDGVTWLPAPRVFQASEMHVYRVVGQSATAWSLQWFGSKRAPLELVGTSSLRFVGARGLQRVLRVEDGIFKGCIVTVLERTGETRISTMGYLRVREGEFAKQIISNIKHK